jgi:hypothetical protein
VGGALARLSSHDPDMAELAIENFESIPTETDHIALTNHAFESTQVARLRNVQLTERELEGYNAWKASEDKKVHERSVRLLLGLR